MSDAAAAPVDGGGAAEEGIPPASASDVVVEGVLQKRSGGKAAPTGKTGNLLNKWDRRFFRLSPYELRWWGSAADAASGAAPKGALLAPGSAVVAAPAGTAKAQLNLVTLVADDDDSVAAVGEAPTRELALQFEDATQLAGWMEALKSVGALECAAADAERVVNEQRGSQARRAAAKAIQGAVRQRKASQAVPAVPPQEREQYMEMRAAAITLQRAVRKRKMRQNLSQVVGAYAALKDDPSVRQIRARNNVVREMLSTETSYVRGLDQLAQAYLQPLIKSSKGRKKQQLMGTAQIKTIFKGVAEIRSLQRNVLELLKAAWADFPNCHVAPVFAQVTPYFKIYTTFINNFDTALQALSEAKAKNKKLTEWLWGVHAKIGVDLESLMITPVQRIPRYEMMLAELLKSTPADHVDRREVLEALQEVRATAKAINDDKEKFERREKVRVVMGTFDLRTLRRAGLELVEPHRCWVAEAQMQVAFGVGGAGAARSAAQPCTVILFSDIVVVRVPNPHPNSAQQLCLGYAVLSTQLSIDRAAPNLALKLLVAPKASDPKGTAPKFKGATFTAMPGSVPGSFLEGGDGLDGFLTQVETAATAHKATL